MKLNASLARWREADFSLTLQGELQALSCEQLPLQQGLRQAGMVSERPFTISVYDSDDDHEYVYVRVGVLYNGIINGCSCSDDPSPDTETNEYCLLRLAIDKRTAQTQVELLDD